jgi:hypothetical protein
MCKMSLFVNLPEAISNLELARLPERILSLSRLLNLQSVLDATTGTRIWVIRFRIPPFPVSLSIDRPYKTPREAPLERGAVTHQFETTSKTSVTIARKMLIIEAFNLTLVLDLTLRIIVHSGEHQTNQIPSSFSVQESSVSSILMEVTLSTPLREWWAQVSTTAPSSLINSDSRFSSLQDLRVLQTVRESQSCFSCQMTRLSTPDLVNTIPERLE